MNTLFLTTDDIRRITRHVGLNQLLDELIVRLEKAIGAFDPEVTIVPERDGFDYHHPFPGLLEWMPVMQLGEKAVIKVVGYHPRSPVINGMPTILSTVSAYDTATGHLMALADATFITALRTGAASALASKHLAHPDSASLGIIGCGAQAVTQLHAISRVFKVKEVLVFDTSEVAMNSLQERVAPLGLRVSPTPLESLIARADILCTVTSVDPGAGPVFPDLNLKPWLHINAAGADFPGKVEVPLTVLHRAFVCPDFPGQALKEGECQRLAPEEIGAPLEEVIKSPGDFREFREKTTVFDSTGWALEDMVTLDLLIECANDLGIGTPLNIESLSEDPKNPYGFLGDLGSETPAGTGKVRETARV